MGVSTLNDPFGFFDFSGEVFVLGLYNVLGTPIAF